MDSKTLWFSVGLVLGACLVTLQVLAFAAMIKVMS